MCKLRTLMIVLLFLAPAVKSHAGGTIRPNLQPLTVADTIASTRFLISPSQEGGAAQGAVSLSPSGNRFLFRLVTGDLLRNQLVLKVSAGSSTSIDAAAQARTVAVLTTSYTHARYWPVKPLSTHPSPIVWRDDDHASFLWEDRSGVVQVMEIDIRSGRRTFLTSGADNVVAYGFGANGALLYMVQPQQDWRESRRLIRDGFVVTNRSLPELVAGHVQGDQKKSRFLIYVRAAGARTARRLPIYADQMPFLSSTSMSPDGRFAIIWATVDHLPNEWARYRSPAPHNLDYFHEAFERRDSVIGNRVGQLYLVDLINGDSRPLWDAPSIGRELVAWAPDSRRLILANTFLPKSEDGVLGVEGRAIVELNIKSGEISPLPSSQAGYAERLHFTPDLNIVADFASQRLTWRKINRVWQIEPESSPALVEPKSETSFELIQDANTPPTLWARDTRTGKRRLVLDPNNDLASRYALGHVEEVKFSDREGRTWTSLLYYPVGYVEGNRYPLVIQLHGHAPINEFSLYGVAQNGSGSGLGPGISVYAAQVLANRGFLVLQLDDLNARNGATIVGTPREGPVYTGAYESAVSYLDKLGLVDPTKVGLSGYSRTAFHIQYAISHSQFHFAAAIASDGVNGSYFEATALPPGESAGAVNGERPYGSALRDWLVRAPAFNADKITTPLMVQAESNGIAGVIVQWEVFSRLRELRRPVEMFVVPDIEHSIHGVQIPRDCLASQERAVDWFDFWLRDHEGSDPSKKDQYLRWRRMKEEWNRQETWEAAGHPAGSIPALP